MKLQYVSDIHLEFRKEIPIICPTGGYHLSDRDNYLALCGDIGDPFLPNYEEFLSIHSKLYQHIIVISGNHEYFHHTIQESNDKILEIVNKYNNITYLNMSSIVIGQTKFVGCTLWSDVSAIKEQAQSFMNDCKKINISIDQKLSVDNIIELHSRMREFLDQEISSSDRDIIVLTHHAPTFGMLPMLDQYSPCYASNCDDLIRKPVKYWISGHTHACLTYLVDNVTCISNCMGYILQESPDFNPSSYLIFY